MTNSRVLNAITKSQTARALFQRSYGQLVDLCETASKAKEENDVVFMIYYKDKLTKDMAELSKLYEKTDVAILCNHTIIRNYKRFIKDEQIKLDADYELSETIQYPSTLFQEIYTLLQNPPAPPG